MAGIMLFVCIPTEKYEEKLKSKKRVNFQVPNNTLKVPSSLKKYIKKIDDEYESTPLLADSNSSNSNTVSSTCNTLKNEKLSMEMITKQLLNTLKIENYSWANKDGKFIQVMFPLESGANCEEIVEIFKENIIDQCKHSVLSVIPCNLYYRGASSKEDEIDEANKMVDAAKNTTWSRFISSVGARLTVAQVVASLKSEANLTFDFICLVIIATILCAIGLVENSNVFLLSSMLICPMMGPVMAGTFGTVIRDKTLFKMGIQNEILGLFIAVIVGFCYGSIICISTDRYGENDWPTSEMSSRGELRALGVGCLVALLSGAAIAVGILSANFRSLVGVAISTSLMPPAVNAGLIWSMSFVYYYKGNETTRYAALSYTEYYSDNHTIELTSLGAVSLCLTFVNIICIYVAGIVIFKIKEVAPIASRDYERRQFWKYGIKSARDYNKTLQNNEQCCDDISYNSMCESTGNCRLNLKNNQFTWSPGMNITNLNKIKKFCNHPMKNISKPLKSNTEKRRSISQIFPNCVNPTSTSNEYLSSIAELGTKTESIESMKTRKFIVTPTTTDPLKSNKE